MWAILVIATVIEATLVYSDARWSSLLVVAISVVLVAPVVLVAHGRRARALAP